MIIRHPRHLSHLSQDPDSISRTFLEQFALVILQVGNADGWEEQESRGVGRGFDKFEMEKCWQC